MKKDILYTFRRCPYAIRARWALLMTNKSVIWREVDLRNKPSELIKSSKKATVPLLITVEGQVLRESYDIMLWAINSSKAHKQFLKKGSNSYKESIHKIFLNDSHFKFHLDRYKYGGKGYSVKKEIHRLIATDILIKWNNNLSFDSCKRTYWLVNGQESIADWSLWPFVRQFRLVDPELFDSNINLKNLRKWLSYFLTHDLFQQLMQKSDSWQPEDSQKYFPIIS